MTTPWGLASRPATRSKRTAPVCTPRGGAGDEARLGDGPALPDREAAAIAGPASGEKGEVIERLRARRRGCGKGGERDGGEGGRAAHQHSL